jgi:hypothetical protein
VCGVRYAALIGARAQLVDVIKQHGLRLALLCLQYDFVGTSPSESTDDTSVLKIPK